MGLGEILTKQAVDDFLLGSIQTKVFFCKQIDFQANPGDIYLLNLLILYYLFKSLLIKGLKLLLVQNSLTA